MRDYEIEYQVSDWVEDFYNPRFERITIKSDSAFNAVAMLGQRIGDSDKSVIEIFSVEEI
jgi:hypothetical protein